MKRLLLSAVLIAVASPAITYMYRYRADATLSPEELRPRTVSPYYSGLPIGYTNTPPTEASYDMKGCRPKVLSVGKMPNGIRFRGGEKPTGLPVVTFQILESGEVVDVALKQSSGIIDKDNAALLWVEGMKYNKRPGCGILETEVGVTIDVGSR